MKSSALWNSMDILVLPWLPSLSRIDRQERGLALCSLDVDIFCLLSWLVQRSVYYQVFLFMEWTPLAQPNYMQMATNGEGCVVTSETLQHAYAISVSAKDFESLSLESVEVRLFGPQHWAEKVKKSDLPTSPVLDSAKHPLTSALGTWSINLRSVDPHASPTKSTADSRFKNKEPEA